MLLNRFSDLMPHQSAVFPICRVVSPIGQVPQSGFSWANGLAIGFVVRKPICRAYGSNKKMYQLLVDGYVVMTGPAEEIADNLMIMSNIEGCRKLDEIGQQIMEGADGGENWALVEKEYDESDDRYVGDGEYE